MYIVAGWLAECELTSSSAYICTVRLPTPLVALPSHTNEQNKGDPRNVDKRWLSIMSPMMKNFPPSVVPALFTDGLTGPAFRRVDGLHARHVLTLLIACTIQWYIEKFVCSRKSNYSVHRPSQRQPMVSFIWPSYGRHSTLTELDRDPILSWKYCYYFSYCYFLTGLSRVCYLELHSYWQRPNGWWKRIAKR